MFELYLERLIELFYDQMDRQTSAFLYGSAATGNWVSTRSDLDLLVFVPKEKLPLLAEKVRAWDSIPKFPILDGYVAYLAGRSLVTIPLERFLKVTYPSDTKIELIDQWFIKNRSKYLFGEDFLNTLTPDISLNDLRKWAFEELKYLVGDSQKRDLPKIDVVLSELIWSISRSARTLMLVRGQVCESKREALQWLANEHDEIAGLAGLLLEHYHRSDDAQVPITEEQSLMLRRFCLELMRREINSSPRGSLGY